MSVRSKIGGARLLFLATIAVGIIPFANCASTAATAEGLFKEHISITTEDTTDAGIVPSFSVSLEVPAELLASSALRLPLSYANVDGIADQIYSVSAADSDGAFQVNYSDDAPGSGDRYRTWHFARQTHGTVIVRYSVPLAHLPPFRGNAPSFGLHTEAGSILGSGAFFIMEPPTPLAASVQVHWDLKNLGKGITAASSFGIGDFQVNSPAGGRVDRAYFAWGSLGHFPTTGQKSGFNMFWQGDPPAALLNSASELQHLYGFYSAFFGDVDTKPYTIFLRPNPANPGSGNAFPRSFMFTYGPATSLASSRITVAHEMLHTWVLNLHGNIDMTWWSEGLATYYARVLGLRAGFITFQEMLTDLNGTAVRYYGSAKRTTPNSDIDAWFWRDSRIRRLPYDRGSLYFASLDADIRKASEGRRSLDDLVKALVHRRMQGITTDYNTWLEMLDAELGPQERLTLDKMLAGELIVPPRDAFGPCIVRDETAIPQYELGFTPDVMNERPAIVRGLIPDSSASKAGIRDGDEILEHSAEDRTALDPTAKMVMRVRRGGTELTITYVPRGAPLPGYQWREKPQASKESCPSLHPTP